MSFKLTWQVNKEWWGRHAVAHHEDYCATIQEMDGKCFWWIREDQTMKSKGVFDTTLDKARVLVTSKLHRVKRCDKINNLFRRHHVTSAA